MWIGTQLSLETLLLTVSSAVLLLHLFVPAPALPPSTPSTLNSWERRGSGHHRRGRDEKMTGTTTTTTEQVAVPVGNVRVVDQV